MADIRPILFRIPPSGLDDLAAMASHSDKLKEIVTLITTSSVQTSRHELAKRVAGKIDIPVADARDVIDGLATLRGLMDRLGLSVEDVVAGIDSSITAQATDHWKNAHQKKWEVHRQPILDALRSLPSESSLTVQQKVRELTFAHQRIFMDASLITDLRPVFNGSGDRILATVLTHLLSIKYQEAGRSREIEFALDAGDILNLFKGIERAQLKTESTRKTFAEKSWELIVPGDNSMAEGESK